MDYDDCYDQQDYWNEPERQAGPSGLSPNNATILLDSDSDDGDAGKSSTHERSLFLNEHSTPIVSAKRTSILRSRNPNQGTSPIFIEDVPPRGAADDHKRFSFGVSGRSMSQSDLDKTPIKYRSNRATYDDITPTASPKKARSANSTPVKEKKQKQKQIVNEFFGCYCLISRSQLKHYKNRCYIGYTVDPNRRIDQHNGGRQKGGAKKTENRGPWEMVCIIHGFPCDVAALRFEWAWQNPGKSRALKSKGLEKKERRETPFAHKLRIACHLLNSDPWRRLALTFRWLLPKEELPFPASIPPPKHFPTKYGLVEKLTTVVPNSMDDLQKLGSCYICKERIVQLSLLGLCQWCGCQSHLRCMALTALSTAEKPNQLIPVDFNCQKCDQRLIWGDVIRLQRNMMKVDEAQPDEKLKGHLAKNSL